MAASPSPFVRAAALVTLASLLGCASSTLIRTEPSGARLYIDGSQVGLTPYTLSDTKVVGSSTSIRIEATGYEPLNTVITRTEELQTGPCIGGILLVPLLWSMGYKSEHVYDLTRARVNDRALEPRVPAVPPPPPSPTPPATNPPPAGTPPVQSPGSATPAVP